MRRDDELKLQRWKGQAYYSHDAHVLHFGLHNLLPIPHHNSVIHSKPTFIVVPNDDQLMLFYVHLLLPHAHIP